MMNNVLLIAYLVLFVFAKGDYLNDYLDDKTFGVNPGPCPFDDGGCEIDLSEPLPPAVGDIEFCLVDSLLLKVCDELKDWVQDGKISIYTVQCRQVGVRSISLEEKEAETTADFVSSRITVQNLFQRCTGGVTFDNVKLKSGLLEVTVPFVSTFETDPRRNGLDVSFDLDLSAEGGFENNLVDNAEVKNCDLNIDLGIRMDDTDFTGAIKVEFFGILTVPIRVIFLEDALVNLLVLLVETLFGGTICAVIEQAGTLNNGNPGVLNTALAQLNEFYDEITVPVDIDVDAFDGEFQRVPENFGSSQEELLLAQNLAESEALEFVSVTLNDFLGDPSVQPLRINQAINLLTDPDGSVFFDVSEFGLTFEVPLSFADASVTLETVTLKDMNTISSFQFLQNDFTENGNGLDFTLKHDFEIDSFQFLFKIKLLLERGTWVTASACGNQNSGFLPEDVCLDDREEFSFDFGLQAKDIVFKAATVTAANVEEIEAIQLGQVFDRDVSAEGGRQALACIAPSVYAFIFSDLQMQVTELADPFVDNFSGEGLTELIENSVDLIAVLLKNVLANDLPTILQGPVRDQVNAILRQNLSDVENLDDCPDYVQEPSDDPYFVFNEPPIQQIFPVLNNVLGNFEADSDVDLNDFIQSSLSYYSKNDEAFPLVSDGADGDWNVKETYLPFVSLPKFEDEDSVMIFEEVRIRNLDSVTEFESKTRKNLPQGLSFDLTFGGDGVQADVFTLILSFFVKDSALGVEEKFDLSILLEEIKTLYLFESILVNSESLFRLKVQQLTHFPCLQSIVDGVKANGRESEFVAEKIGFNLDFLNQDSGSDFRGALETLQNEFLNPTDEGRFTRTVTYFVDLAFEAALNELEALNYSLTPEECDDVESGFGFIGDLFGSVGSVNFTFFAEECLKDIPPLQPLEEFELEQLGVEQEQDLDEFGDFFKFKTSFLIKLLGDAFNIDGSGDGDAATLNNLLVTFANSTGNTFVDLFTLEEDGETVTFSLALNESNGFLELIGLDPLSITNEDGFKAEVQSLRIRGINNFLQELQLFQTLSNFTSFYHLGFSEDTPLTAELDFLLELNASFVDEEPFEEEIIREPIRVDFQLTGVSIDLEVFSAFRSDTFKNLSVAHFWNITEEQEFNTTDFATDCFLRNFAENGFQIRTFQTDVSEITKPEITALNTVLSPGVEGVIEEFSAIFIDFYKDALPNICENCIRNAINSNLAVAVELAKEEGACPEKVNPPQVSKENEIFRFSDSQGFIDFQKFLNENVFSDDYFLWNVLVEGFTAEAFFDTDPFDSGLLDLYYKEVYYGSMQVFIDFLKVNNWNTFTYVELFSPELRENNEAFDEETDPYRVVLAFDFAGETDFISHQTYTGHELFVQDPEVVNELALDFAVSNFSFALESLLKVNLNTLMKIQFNQVDSLEELPCLLTPIESLNVEDFNLTIGNLKVKVDCDQRCDAELLEDLTAGGPFESQGSEASDALDSFITFVVAYLESSPAERLINVFLATSEETCASLVGGINGFLEEEEDVDVFESILYVFVAVAAFGLMAAFYQVPRHRMRKRQILREFEAIEDKKFSNEEEMRLLENELRALSGSPVVPTFAKVLIPLISVANVISLMVAILSQGILTIFVKLTVLSMQVNTIDLVPLTSISIVNSVWATGAWPLAILVAVGSCAWPIVRNVLLMLIFYTPTTILSHKQRSMYLEKLDLAGKWAFIEVFVVVVTLGALITSLDLASQEDLQFLDPRAFKSDVSLRPEKGILLVALVACISLVLNQVLSYYDRATRNFYREEYDKVANNRGVPLLASSKKSIVDYSFRRRVVDKKKMRLLLLVNVVSGALLFAGLVLPIITFEIRGLVGLFAGELDPNQVLKTYSVVGLGAVIQEAQKDTNGQIVFTFLFQFLYFVISVGGPLAQIVMQTILFTRKLSLKNTETILSWTLIASFWSASEVVFVGIIGTLVEVGPITQFIVDYITNDICTNVQDAIAVFVPDEKNDACVDVVGFLEIGALPMALGILGQTLVLVVGGVMTKRIVEDRYFFAYVKCGLRPRDKKPGKLGYFRSKIFKFFTKPKANAVRSPVDRNPEEELSDNPTFSQRTTGNPMFQQREERETTSNPMFQDKNPRLSELEIDMPPSPLQNTPKSRRRPSVKPQSVKNSVEF